MNEYHAKIRKICLYGLNRTNIDNHIDGIDETHSKKIFIYSLKSIKKRSAKNKFTKTIHLGEYKEKLSVLPAARFNYANAQKKVQNFYGVQTLDAYGNFAADALDGA